MQTAHRSMGCAHMQHLWGGEKLLPRNPSIQDSGGRDREGGIGVGVGACRSHYVAGSGVPTGP